jgi:hypothetical protein
MHIDQNTFKIGVVLHQRQQQLFVQVHALWRRLATLFESLLAGLLRFVAFTIYLMFLRQKMFCKVTFFKTRVLATEALQHSTGPWPLHVRLLDLMLLDLMLLDRMILDRNLMFHR